MPLFKQRFATLRQQALDRSGLENRQFATQWLRDGVLVLLISGLCFAAMVMAWRASQPMSELDQEARISASISEQTGKVALLTAELQYWQSRVVQEFDAQGVMALGIDGKARSKHNALMAQLSAAVDRLSGETLSNTQRASTMTLVSAMDQFELADKAMIKALIEQTPKRQTTAMAHFEKTRSTAVQLLEAAKLLNEQTNQQSQTLQARVMNDAKSLWQWISFAMGAALVFAASLAWMLRRAIQKNGDLLRQVNLLARTDPLTGLLNRRAMEQRIEADFKRNARDGTGLCLVLIDLDFFKQFNDTHGHVQGDEHLKTCAKAWSKQVRASDLVARMGGEEFALVLNRCTAEQAVAKTHALRLDMPWNTSFSAGIAVWQPGESFVSMYQRADAALYEAKAQGRATSVVAEANLIGEAHVDTVSQ